MPPGKPIRRSSPCPCCSGSTYGDCCLAFHRGEREAPDPMALMRSRYAAFALGEIEYLVRTLHPDHPDRAVPEAALRATLGSACRTNRYMGLAIREQTGEGDRATVEFLAKVFSKGIDHSFVERSTFERTAEGWRYLSGETMDAIA